MTLYQMCVHIQNASLNTHISSHYNGVQCVEFGCSSNLQVPERHMSRAFRTCNWCGRNYEYRHTGRPDYCGAKCESEHNADRHKEMFPHGEPTNRKLHLEPVPVTNTSGWGCIRPIAFIAVWALLWVLLGMAVFFTPLGRLRISFGGSVGIGVSFVATVFIFWNFRSR